MPISINPATIFAAFLFGAISAYAAYRRGRNPYKWFFAGFLFGALGAVFIFLAPKKKTVPQAAAAQPIEEKLPPAILGPSDKFWYYLDPSHEQQGPMSHTALTSALRQGKISLSTYVWNEEMSDWKELKEFVR